MNIQSFGAMLVGFVPAIVLLYIMLDRYEAHVDDRKLFFAFMLGLFAGLLAACTEMLNLFTLYDPGLLGLISILGIALLQEALKTLLLTLRRFARTFELTFYGAALGLGFGAAYAFFAAGTQMDFTKPIEVALGIAMVIGIIELHGALGALIGYGISVSRLLRFFVLAVIIHTMLNLAIWSSLPVTFELFVVIALFTLAYGTGWLIYILRNFIPSKLPEKLRKELRRRKRQELKRESA